MKGLAVAPERDGETRPPQVRVGRPQELIRGRGHQVLSFRTAQSQPSGVLRPTNPPDLNSASTARNRCGLRGQGFRASPPSPLDGGLALKPCPLRPLPAYHSQDAYRAGEGQVPSCRRLIPSTAVQEPPTGGRPRTGPLLPEKGHPGCDALVAQRAHPGQGFGLGYPRRGRSVLGLAPTRTGIVAKMTVTPTYAALDQRPLRRTSGLAASNHP